MRNKLIIFLLFLFFFVKNSFSQTFWEQADRFGGGYVTCFAEDNLGKIFVGTADNKIYYTANKGNSWVLVKEFLHDDWETYGATTLYGIGSIKITTDNTIFCVIYSSGFSSYLFRSADNGKNWKICQKDLGWMGGYLNPSTFTIDLKNQLFCYKNGIIRSTDKGNSWYNKMNPLSDIGIYSFYVDNKNNIFFLSTQTGQDIYDNLACSRDSGKTFTQCVLPLSNKYNVYYATVSAEGEIYYCNLDQSKPNTISYKIFCSKDFGTTFQLFFEWSWQVDQIIFGNYLIIRRNNGDFIFLHEKGNVLFKISNNSMTTHTPRIDATNNLTFSCLFEETDGTLWASSLGYGVFTSIDGGINWIKNGFSSLPISSFITDDNNFYFGTHYVYMNNLRPDRLYQEFFIKKNGGEIKKSYSKGDTYKEINNIFKTKEKKIIMNSDGDGVYSSTDDGVTWSRIFQDQKSFRFLTQNSSGVLFALENSGIMKSTDDGSSWSYIITQVSSELFKYQEKIFLNKKGEPYLITGSGGAYCSGDGGVNWTNINNRYITSSSISDGKYIYLGVYGSDSLFVSEDEGKKWRSLKLVKNISQGWRIGDLLCDGKDNVYALIDSVNVCKGVFMSTNHGETWSEINSGWNGENIKLLYLSNSGYIYAVTDEVIYKSKNAFPLSVKNKIANINKDYYLFQNYPNPFNPNTIIHYELPKECFVSIKIYNMLGQEVAMLVNDIKEAGKYIATFNSKNLPSGTYYYKLNAGTYSEVKKMMLMK